MRISVQNSDPGYFEGSYRCAVYLDGVKLNDCVTADEEEGIAVCYDLATPHPYGAEVPMVERRGKVKISTRDESGTCVLCGGCPGAHRPDCKAATLQDIVQLANGSMMGRRAYEDMLEHPAIKTALAAIRINASEPLGCPECGCDHGHTEDCTLMPSDFRELVGERFQITGSSAWVGEDGVKREAPEFTRVGTNTVEHNFSTAHAATIAMVRELWRKQMAYQWGGKFWRVTSVVEREPSIADVRSIEAHRPATFFDLQAWIVGEITSVPIELDCPPLPVIPIPQRLFGRSKVAAMMAARRARARARARKPTPFTEHDEGVHRAISAMQKPGRANEL